MDGLTVPGSFTFGPFIKNMPVSLLAKSKPGYEFVGWVRPRKQELVSRGAEWSYLDNGTDPGSGWTEREFNDAAWSSGYARWVTVMGMR